MLLQIRLRLMVRERPPLRGGRPEVVRKTTDHSRVPVSRRIAILSVALLASIALLIWDRTRPTYVSLIGPISEKRQATVVEVLSHAGLDARPTEDRGVEVRKGEKAAAFMALVRDPRFSPGY